MSKFCENTQQCKNMVALSNAFITQVELCINIEYFPKTVWATKGLKSFYAKYDEFGGDKEAATIAAINKCAEHISSEKAA